MNIVEKNRLNNKVIVYDNPAQKLVEGLSKIDMSKVTKDCNLSELIADITSASSDVEDKSKKLKEYSDKKKESNWLFNKFNGVNDDIKVASFDLQSSIVQLSQKSGKLLTINTAISKVLYNQQHVLNQQQYAINDSNNKLVLQSNLLIQQQNEIKDQQEKISIQNDEIQEQARKIKKQNDNIQKQSNALQIQNNKITKQNDIIKNNQNELKNANQRLSIQQSEINKAHEGLLRAKSMTNEQAQKLINIVDKTESLEGKLQKSNEDLKEYILSEIYKQEYSIDSFRQEIDYKFISINNKILASNNKMQSNKAFFENELKQTKELIENLKQDVQDKYQRMTDALYLNEKNNLLLLNEYKIKMKGSFESFYNKIETLHILLNDNVDNRFEVMVNMFERNKTTTEQNHLKIKQEIIEKNKSIKKTLKRYNMIISLLSLFTLGSVGLVAYIVSFIT